MTKQEFLMKLKEALENELNAREVQENLNFYNSYISDEMAKGRSEREVLDELGDPWVIAQSVIAAAENRLEPEEGYREERRKTENRKTEHQTDNGWNNNGFSHVYSFGFDSWWKKLLAIIVIFFVVGVVFAIIGGVLSLLMPVLLPICFILLAIRLLTRRR